MSIKNTLPTLTKAIDGLDALENKHNSLISEMMQGLYEDKAYFDADFVRNYHATEKAADRTDIQNKVLRSYSDKIAGEIDWIADQMEMNKSERDEYKLEEAKRRHAYLRTELHKGMQALVFFRNGGSFDGGKTVMGEITAIKVVKGRFQLWFTDPDDGERVKSQATYSARAIILAGQKKLESLGLRKSRKSNGPNVEHSPRATLQTTARTFKSSLDAMLSAQTAAMRATNPNAEATVSDLPDEAEESFESILKTAIRLQFEHNGTVDMVDVEEWLASQGFKVGMSTRRKRA